MSKVYLPHRLIFDSEGVMKIHNKLGKESFASFIYKLMYINTNIRPPTKKNHIITSKKSFELFSEKLSKNVDESTFNLLVPAIRPQEEPTEVCTKLEAIDDEIKRIWEYVIYVSSVIPYATIIFTSKERIVAYEVLKKKDGKENILINDEDETIQKVEKYNLLCKEGKEGS